MRMRVSLPPMEKVYPHTFVGYLPRTEHVTPIAVKNFLWWFSCPISAIELKLRLNNDTLSSFMQLDRVTVDN